MACLSVEITIFFLVFVLFLSFLPGEGCRAVRGNPGRLLSLHRNVSTYIQCSCCKRQDFFCSNDQEKRAAKDYCTSSDAVRKTRPIAGQ